MYQNNNLKEKIIIKSNDCKTLNSYKIELIFYSQYLQSWYSQGKRIVYFNFKMNIIKIFLERITGSSNHFTIKNLEDFFDLYEFGKFLILQNGSEILIKELNFIISKEINQNNWFSILEKTYEFMIFEDIFELILKYYFDRILTKENILNQIEFIKNINHDLNIILKNIIKKTNNLL